MKSARQMSMLLLAIFSATLMAGILFSPALSAGVEPVKPRASVSARPPQQDPPPTPPPPPDDGGNIFQNITQLINFPFENLVEALQNAMEAILRGAMTPIQSMFEAVLSLWLANPGILSNGNAALPGWDLMRDAWQFMYSIAIAFWPLTLAVVAAIAAKDAVAAATWGLGDLKSALGTWFVAVLLSATSLWWMDLANNLANAITSYVLYNFAGPQFFPGTFLVFFSVILPGLFLVFPLAGILLVIFLVILAITIFVGLTFAIIARLVLMYLLVALGPLAIILGVLPPLRFVTHMWTRGLILVLALGPIDALLLKLAFNVAQYASSAPPVQAVAAFIGVFGLLSILITINFALVKTVFGAVIAVANQTLHAVQAAGQMVVAGALLMSGAGAGAGIAMGGSAMGSATGGGGGVTPSGGALGNAGGNSTSGLSTNTATPTNGNTAPRQNGNSPWRPTGRGMALAGSYLQSTHGPLAGFGALLRAAGMDQIQQERAGGGSARSSNGGNANSIENFGDAPDRHASPQVNPGNARDGVQRGRADTPSSIAQPVRVHDGREGNTQNIGSGEGFSNQKSATTQTRAASTSENAAGIGGAAHASQLQNPLTSTSGKNPSTRDRGGTVAVASPNISPKSNAGVPTGTPTRTQSSVPPRRANLSAIQESRAAMGFDSRATANAPAPTTTRTSSPSKELPDAHSNPLTDHARAETETSAPSQSGLNVSNAEHTAPTTLTSAATNDARGDADEVESSEGANNAIVQSDDKSDGNARAPIVPIAPEAERTLSMLPDESGDARMQAAQLVSHYSDEGQQSQTAIALEQGMRVANEQHGIAWSHMGEAAVRGLWSTREAANHHTPINDMARQMEPFSGSRDSADYVAWQIASRGEQFQVPSQQIPYLSAPGPYEYQAGRYVEQQLGGAIGYQDAAKMFYVIRDPSTPGGGWSKAQQFIGEVNRISTSKANEPLLELDRWMQVHAPTRARVLWNMHMRIVDGK